MIFSANKLIRCKNMDCSTNHLADISKPNLTATKLQHKILDNSYKLETKQITMKTIQNWQEPVCSQFLSQRWLIVPTLHGVLKKFRNMFQKLLPTWNSSLGDAAAATH